MTTTTRPTYRVVRYAADGCSDHQGEVIASRLSLRAAKALADQGHGSWIPPEDGGVIGYHDSDALRCGGYLVEAEGSTMSTRETETETETEYLYTDETTSCLGCGLEEERGYALPTPERSDPKRAREACSRCGSHDAEAL